MRKLWFAVVLLTIFVAERGAAQTPVGTFTSQYRPVAQGVIDARNATFLASESNTYPVYLESGSQLLGGVIIGNFDVNQTWSYFSNLGGPGLYLRLHQQTPFVVDGVRIDNLHDGIRLRENVKNFSIRNAYLTNIHDDCIENDFYFSGIVEDSLLDGCYTAFSAREGSGEAIGGPNELWEIRNNLVRKQAFNGPYAGPSPGHGPTFKLNQTAEQGLAPNFVLHDNIFRIDQPASHGAHLLPPEARIASCSNNILVWLGGGAFPGDLGRDPVSNQPCFTVVTDVAVWDNAKAAWLAAHGYGEQPPPNEIVVSVTPNKMDFAAVQGTQPAAKNLGISASPQPVQWSASATAAWITLSSTAGTTPTNLSVAVNTTGLAVGNYLSSVVISSPGANVSVPISLTVTAPTPPSSGPAIVTPAPGSLLGSSVTFTWVANGVKVKKWELLVGTSQGGQQIHNSGKLNGTSRTVSGILPGRVIWVRLRFDANGTWQFRDFQYKS
jgi:hypothetical protein